MGWMKAIYTDIHELNESFLNIYEDVTEHPDDAVGPLAEYLSANGWKTPTEMLALKQGITAHLQRIYGDDQSAAVLARAELNMELVSAFGIEPTDILPALPVSAMTAVDA